MRIIRRGEWTGDVVFGAEVGHLLAGEISSAVGDAGVGGPEAFYVLIEEFDNLLPTNFEERHCLDPFGIVNGY